MKESSGNFTCVCNDFFFGQYCESFDSCAAGDYCMNEGRCSYENDTPVCECELGFEGEKCETKVELEAEQNDTFDNIVQEGTFVRKTTLSRLLDHFCTVHFGSF